MVEIRAGKTAALNWKYMVCVIFLYNISRVQASLTGRLINGGSSRIFWTVVENECQRFFL